PTLEETLNELRRKWRKWKAEAAAARPPIRLPDTEQTRRDLAHGWHHYELRQCERSECGRSFFADHGRASYCSRECQQADRRDRRAETRERERQRRDRDRKSIKCARCGKRVPPERSTRRYCSDAWREAAYRQG